MREWAGKYAQQLTALTLETYGLTCHLCGEPGADTADHILPRSAGGDDSLDNLRPAHGPCNYARAARPLSEWRKKYGPKKGRNR